MMVIPLSKQDLLDIVAAASTLDERLDKEFLPDDVRANDEILVPFVLLARRQYTLRARDAYALLCEEAHVALQRSLLQTLTDYAAQALYLEFAIERAQTQSSLERFLTMAQEHDERIHYQKFVERMRQGGLITFFREYSVLARLLSTITDLWVEATVEFRQRLAADWSDIH